MGDSRQNVPIQSVDRSIQLLEALRQHEKASVTTLASEADAAKSTVHNHLLTLQHRGLVARDNDGLFQLGPAMLKYGDDFKRRYDFISEIAPAVQTIATESGELCTFVVEMNKKGVITLASGGKRDVSTELREGVSGPIHTIPGGKAILAYHSELRDKLVNGKSLSQGTDNALSDPERLDDELNRVIAQGYSMNDEEYRSGLRAISVPMLPKDDQIVGALAVIGPTNRINEPERTQEILNLLFSVQEDFPVYKSSSTDDEETVPDERISFWTQYGSS